jgi:hypothetical protein
MRAGAQWQFVDCCSRSSDKAAARCGLSEPAAREKGHGCDGRAPDREFPVEWMCIGTPIPVKMFIIKTLNVEAVYVMDYETFADVTVDLPRLGEGDTPHHW